MRRPRKNMTGAAIEMKGLGKRFGETVALDGLNLEIGQGELFGLLGPNGAGKSTTINILTGLLEPTAGSARVGGHALPKEARAVKEIIGVCPQEFGVFPYLTGRENVLLFGDLAGVPKKELEARADDLLKRMGLDGESDRRVRGYSGGMKRRISVVTALIGDPEIAFLDEPTTGLDPQSRRAVWDFILTLKARRRTVVLTTHYMEEAEALCDRVAIIDHGSLIALGTPAELKAQNGSKDLEEVFLKLTGRRIREGM
jgi:ABC-2 type transport system ATP-binding protein